MKPRYDVNEEEVQRIASEADFPASEIRDAIGFIPPEVRPQFTELLKTDSRAAGIMAREYGWNPGHVFDSPRR